MPARLSQPYPQDERDNGDAAHARKPQACEPEQAPSESDGRLFGGHQ
jgi:hypothetical protein